MAVWLFYTCKIAGTNKGVTQRCSALSSEEVPVFGPNEKGKTNRASESFGQVLPIPFLLQPSAWGAQYMLMLSQHPQNAAVGVVKHPLPTHD